MNIIIYFNNIFEELTLKKKTYCFKFCKEVDL